MLDTKRKGAKRAVRNARKSGGNKLPPEKRRAQGTRQIPRLHNVWGRALPDIGYVQLTESPRIVWEDKGDIVIALAIPITKEWIRQHRNLFAALLTLASSTK